MSDKIAPENTNKPPKKFENGERLPLVWERILCLILAALFGLWLAQNANQPLQKLLGFHPIFPFLPEDKGSTQLAILLMSLPVFFALWLFRTWDTREQIQKAGESAEAARQSAEIAKQGEKTARQNVETAQKTLEANTLARNIDMLSSNDLRTRCIGLVQLTEIKRQGNFVKEVDSATRQGLGLNEADFRGENLSGVNLERVFLNKANLSQSNLSDAYLHHAKMDSTLFFNADLTNADLSWSNLRDARFTGARLNNADLRNADLRGARELEYTILKGAKYNDGTKFPESFEADRKKNAEKMGMEYVRDMWTRP